MHDIKCEISLISISCGPLIWSIHIQTHTLAHKDSYFVMHTCFWALHSALFIENVCKHFGLNWKDKVCWCQVELHLDILQKISLVY